MAMLTAQILLPARAITRVQTLVENYRCGVLTMDGLLAEMDLNENHRTIFSAAVANEESFQCMVVFRTDVETPQMVILDAVPITDDAGPRIPPEYMGITDVPRFRLVMQTSVQLLRITERTKLKLSEEETRRSRELTKQEMARLQQERERTQQMRMEQRTAVETIKQKGLTERSEKRRAAPQHQQTTTTGARGRKRHCLAIAAATSHIAAPVPRAVSAPEAAASRPPPSPVDFAAVPAHHHPGPMHQTTLPWARAAVAPPAVLDRADPRLPDVDPWSDCAAVLERAAGALTAAEVAGASVARVRRVDAVRVFVGLLATEQEVEDATTPTPGNYS